MWPSVLRGQSAGYQLVLPIAQEELSLLFRAAILWQCMTSVDLALPWKERKPLSYYDRQSGNPPAAADSCLNRWAYEPNIICEVEGGTVPLSALGSHQLLVSH